MKKMYKKEEGVSPVIATILMVAITVVLATTVWLLVSGYMSPTTRPLQGYLNYNTLSSNPDDGWYNFTAQLSQPTEGVPNSSLVLHFGDKKLIFTKMPGNIKNLGDQNWTYIDEDGNGKLSNGDIIIIHYSSGKDAHGTTITLAGTGGYSGTASGTIP